MSGKLAPQRVRGAAPGASGAGRLDTWIDIGAPSAERLHKAAKAARRVVIYTSANLSQLRKEAARRSIHRMEEIVVWSIPGDLLDALAAKTDRTMKLELVRNEEQVYATLDGMVIEGRVTASSLLEP